MAEFGKKKRPLYGKPMTEFKKKESSLVSKVSTKLTSAGKTIKNTINRNVSKVATREELREIDEGVYKISKSNTAKSVGGFLRGWARASKRALDMPSQPAKKEDLTAGQQFKPAPDTCEGVLPVTAPVDSAPIKTEDQ